MTKKTHNTAKITTSSNAPSEIAHGIITIDRTEIATLARMDNEPCLIEANIELMLPSGRGIEDTFVAKAERELGVKDLAPELSFSFDENSVIVTGPVQARRWVDSYQVFESELEAHFDAIARALTAVTKVGVDVTLTPGLAHDVKYQHERGSHNESALRELYDNWRVNMTLEPQGLRFAFGDDIRAYKDEMSFGWEGKGWSIRYSWIPRLQAARDGLVLHALIRCDVQCDGRALHRIHRCKDRLGVHEAATKAGDLYRLFFLVSQLPDVVVDMKTVNIAGLISPQEFFFAGVKDA